MKVKEPIERLQKADPEKQVMIQQEEYFDYMGLKPVKEEFVEIGDGIVEERNTVVINYH